ncbi:MAG: alpha/beta hydrolase [Fibrobacterales bacterium]
MPTPLQCIEKKTSPTHTATIIWLHGLGDSGFGHEPIAEEMNVDPALGIKFIFPHAPQLPVTINGGMVMPAWYDILEANLGRKIDEAGIEESSQQISDIIQDEIESGISADRIILAGFSQGGAVALHTALKYPVKLGGIIAMSTYLGVSSVLNLSTSAINKNVPIYWGHGSQDPIVPLRLAKESIDAITKGGYSVTLTEFPMEHSIHPHEIEEVKQYIISQLT